MTSPMRGPYKKRPRTTKIESLDMTDPDGFGRWITRHIEWMRVRNYSEETVSRREPWLVAFAAWCAVRAIHRPREVTKPILERYRRHLYFHRKPNGRPLAFGSQRNRLAPLRTFFSWMTRENALLWNPASELDMPKVEKRLPRALTIGQVEAVLAQPDVSDPRGLRDRAIMETLYSTGMRRIELLHLRVTDLAAAHGTVFIRRGKGKRERIVPIGERAIHWVEKYISDVRPLFIVDDREESLFVSELGTAFHPGTLTHRVQMHVRAAKAAPYGSCHLFRHTMATLMLEGGADVRFIQEILGHANLGTTEIYTRVSIKALKAVHEATHPAASLHPSKKPTPLASTSRDAAELFSLLAAESEDELDEGESDRDDAGELGLKKTTPASSVARALRKAR